MRGGKTVSKDIANDEIMNALKNIGLNLYERRLYTSLLTRGTATAGELAEISGVPRARVYDVLETLADKGYVMIRNSKPISYVAVPPKEAVNRAAKRMQEMVQKQLAELDKFKESEHMRALEQLHNLGMENIDASELVGMIKGKSTILQHQESIISSATKSIDILTSERGLEEIYRNYSATLQEAAERGIKIRILAPLTENNKEVAEMLSSFADIKDLSNIQDRAPYTNMVISDNKQVILSMTHDLDTHPTQQTSLWSASQHFAENFAAKTFNLLWEMA